VNGLAVQGVDAELFWVTPGVVQMLERADAHARGVELLG
jgi:hypothetical protein